MFPGCRALTFQDSDLVTPGLRLLPGYLVYSELGGTEAEPLHQVPPLNRSWISALLSHFVSVRPDLCPHSVPTKPSTFETILADTLKPVYGLMLFLEHGFVPLS